MARPQHYRSRPKTQLCYFAVIALLAATFMPPSLALDRYETQRASFEKVLKAQSTGKHKLAGQLALGLENYPLYPYFHYYDLRRRLHHHPSDEVARFLTAYDNSYLSSRLREEWLTQLNRAKRWQAFLDFYRPTDDVKLRCVHLEARIRSGLTDGVLADTRAIWLHGASLPDECDPAFKRLYSSNLMGDDLLWQRIRLAMAKNNSGLARYLCGRLRDPRYQALHDLWTKAHANPRRALSRGHLDDDADTRAIMIHAVRRLLRATVESAEREWMKIAARLSFTSAEAGEVAAAIATAAAQTEHRRRIELLDAVPDISITPTVERYRLREGIAAKAWTQLARWTESSPSDGINALRWRYWHARALLELGQTEQAQIFLQELSHERDYYGFLASDYLGRDYTFNFVAIGAKQVETDALMAIPGIPRARELYLLERKFQARQEWAFELARLDRRQLEIAATIAANWNWPDHAIFALGRAKSYDDLELRFPLLHTTIAQAYAKRRKLEPARVMAIIRSESAFVSDARSGAGALGLMQLMPATARATAKRIGLKLGSAKQLYDPERNIALGTAYLEQMLRRFGDNFAMAAAAYNAGPHRVRQWRNARCTEADIWIDTIPFTETRRYVRRAFLYAAIYQWRMGQDITKMTDMMPPVPAAGSNNIVDCKT